MKGKVELEILSGAAAGKTYTYTEQERVFIGRQEDCAVVIPEKTVSRYHCVLEMMPPEVKLQDFGSLNGTYLNGKKVGQRERTQSAEEAAKNISDAVELSDGDVLGLGKSCELKVKITRWETCPECGAVMSALQDAGLTVSESGPDGPFYDKRGRRICKDCYERLLEEERLEQERLAAEKAEQERLAAEQAQREAAEALMASLENKLRQNKQHKCASCGKTFTPTSPDNNLCPDCMEDQAKLLLDGILAALMGAANAEEDELSPSFLEGFDKVSLLGKGGMGEVWKVKERKTGKVYALKTMLPSVAADEHSKRLFLREAQISTLLKHKNVVRAYDSGCANGVFYILMDLCEGGSVDSLMEKKGGKLSLELATYITLQVLSGLDYVHNLDMDVEIRKGLFRGTKEVHTKGAVHRDFKPGNIFLTDRSDHPVAMVADFGMAKAYQTAGLSNVSASGSVMGTPVFMPKQQLKNCKYAKPEVDVWAAAASYYYMITGEFVRDFYSGRNPMQIILTEKAIPIRQRDPSVPVKLANVIDRALQEDPAIGYSSASEFRKDLIDALPTAVRTYCKGVLK